MNIQLQTDEQLSATVANGLAGVFVNGVSLSTSLSGKADLTALQDYYTKSETSSASEIYNGISSKLDSSSAAPEFDVLSTYSPWQYVTYEGKLWRFITQHVSGDWNAAQVELVDMTTPDATLDLMNDGRLRVVLADGTTVWTQGYSMVSAASSLSTLLSCEAVNFYKYAQTTASAFSDLSAYAIGDRVIHQSSVYTFISAHAAGAWASAEVDLDPDSHMFMMPSVPAGKVGDFVLDIDNTANSDVGVIATLNNLSTAFDMYVPAGESLYDTLSFEANEQCELYFTMTAFGTAAKPAWKVVKQVVEKQGAGV